MHSISFILFLPTLFLLTEALSVSPRGPIGLPGAVYVCPKEAFGGPDCMWIPPTTECHINSGLKSIGPDQGGYCRLYKDHTCGKQDPIWVKEVYWPGISIASDGSAFRSMRCQPTICTASGSPGCPSSVKHR